MPYKFPPRRALPILAACALAAAVTMPAHAAQFPFAAAPATTPAAAPAVSPAPAGKPAAAVVTPAATPVVAPTAATGNAAKAPPNYSAIYEKNIFDPQRKQWEEKKEVPPPLPPLAAEDVQIYGVMAVGSYRRAIVKLGGKLKHLMPTDPKARPFVTLSEGQSLAGYTLAEIGPQRLVFTAGETRYAVSINKKEDRPTAPPAPPPAAFQEAVVVTVETPNGANGQPLPAGAPATIPAQDGSSVVQAPPAAVAATPEAAPAAPAASANAGNTGNNPAPADSNPGRAMSLLEAIQQAKSNGGGQSSGVNPFSNLAK